MTLKLKPVKRVAAVDVLRALTMTLMLFVNDFAGMPGIPHWLEHAAANEDMLGFSDVIFPAFIFCMGMSVVLAVEARYRKGDSTGQVISHMFWRTVALLVMGLFTLNCSAVGVLSYNVFVLLMILGFFLVWAVYPKVEGRGKYIVNGLKTAGVLLLAALVVYKDLCGQPFQTGWWGILGLIGWTYAVCAVLYLCARGSFRTVAVLWLALILLSLGSHSQIIPYGFASRVVLLEFIPSDWSLHAIGFSGVLTILTLQRLREQPKRLLAILFGGGLVMLACGLFAHSHWIVSKIQATPTYLFYNLAMFFPITGLLYVACDLKGHAGAFNFIRPAGTATLTCYLLPYVWYGLLGVFGLRLPQMISEGTPGLIRAAVFALAMVWLTGVLERCKIKIKI